MEEDRPTRNLLRLMTKLDQAFHEMWTIIPDHAAPLDPKVAQRIVDLAELFLAEARRLKNWRE